MNILIAINSQYMGPTGVFLYSLCAHHKDTPVDIYVAFHNLKEEDIKTLESLVNLFENKRIIPIDMGTDFASRMNEEAAYSCEVYYRILALEYLPENVDRILYLDCDMAVNGDLLEVYNSELPSECPMLVCADHVCYRDNAFRICTRRSFIPDDAVYFNSGFLLINVDYFRRRKEIVLLKDIFLGHGDVFGFPDQDILNHVYYDRVKFVPWQMYNIAPGYYVLDMRELAKDNIRFASYDELDLLINSGDGVIVSEQMARNSRVIHYMWILKPWKFAEDAVPDEMKYFAEIWYNAKHELLNAMPELEKFYK